MYFKKKFLSEDISSKLNVINYQIKKMVKHHYYSLYQHWKLIDLTPEIFFSGFVISLFSSFFIKNQNFVHEFWDIILIVILLGKMDWNCEMFIFYN